MTSTDNSKKKKEKRVGPWTTEASRKKYATKGLPNIGNEHKTRAYSPIKKYSKRKRRKKPKNKEPINKPQRKPHKRHKSFKNRKESPTPNDPKAIHQPHEGPNHRS